MYNKFLKFASMVLLLCSFLVGQEESAELIKDIDEKFRKALIDTNPKTSIEKYKEMIAILSTLPKSIKSLKLSSIEATPKHFCAMFSSIISLKLYELARYSEAIEYIENTLDLLFTLDNRSEIDVANCYQLLGLVYISLDNQEKAIASIKEALNRFNKLPKVDTVRSGIATSHSNLGLALYHLKNYEGMLKKYEESLQIYKSVNNSEVNIATCYHYIGQAHLENAKNGLDKDGLSKAYEKNETALQIRKIKDKNNLAFSYKAKAAILAYKAKVENVSSTEKINEIMDNIRLAVAEFERLYKNNPQHPELATAYNDIGTLLVTEVGTVDACKEGLKYHQKALGIYNQVYKSMDFTHPNVATSQINIAIALFHLGRFKDAKEMTEKSYEASKKLFEIRWSALQTRLKIRHDEEYFDRCLAVFLSLSKEFPSQEILSKYLSAVVYHKNVVTRVLSLERKIAETVKDDAKLQEVYRDYQAKLRDFIERSYDEKDTNFDNVIKEKERLEARLSKEIRGILGETIPNVNPAQIQEKISNNTAILEYVKYFNHNHKKNWLGVFVIRKEKIEFFPLGNNQDIRDQIEVFRKNIQSKRDIKEVLEYSDALYKKLFPSNLCQFLSDVNTLFVSPDDTIHFLPFAALWTQKNKYLVEEYKLAYLASSEILLDPLKEPQKEYGQEMYVVGNPDFDLNLSDDEVVQIDKKWEGLHQSDEELLSVGLFQQKLSKKEPLQPRKDEEALKQHFVDTFTKINDIYWIHILSHASSKLAISNTNLDYAQEFEPLVRFGIVFAGANCKNNSPSQYLLTAADIILFKLKNKCTVLSCCETAIGPDLSGVGIYNFKWSFSYAGSENLLLSLWKISDKDTPTLMNRFYEKMSLDLQPWEVLVETQRELISEKKFSHPYFWSTFICQTNNIQPSQNTATAKWKWDLYAIALIFGSIVFCGFYLLLKKKK